MSTQHRSRNRAILRFILLPMIFLMVALLGGLRIDSETHTFIFLPPPLFTLILSVMLVTLCVRGGAINLRAWVSSEQPMLTNVSHVLTLLALYFASAQAFNTVLPERGLFFWLFSFFFLWTLWNNQFSNFDARLLLRSLAVLFGTAFFLKYLLLASLFSTGGSFGKQLIAFFVDVSTLGTIDFLLFAPATGYISFFTLALYVGGLILLTPSPEPEETDARSLLRAYHNLPAIERATVREAIAGETRAPTQTPQEALMKIDDLEITGELIEPSSEETLIRKGSEK
jgi:hypothetical protein